MKKALFLLALFPLLLLADIPVTVPASSLSTTSGGGVSSSGRWRASEGGFQISWNITQSGSNYNYIYTVSKESGAGLFSGVDAVVLELNPAVTPSNLSAVITSLSGATITSGPRTFVPGDSGSSSYPYLPGNIYGILLDPGGAGVATISFTSTNAPVWGSFYADNGLTGGGSRGYAYNSAFSSDPTPLTVDFTGWVPTVGGLGVLVPEPTTMLILGSMLAVAIYMRRRQLRTKT